MENGWILRQKTGDLINPANGELLAKSLMSTKEETEEVIESTKNAFWRRFATHSRSIIRYLYDFRDVLEENFDELAEIITLEHGMILDESRYEYRRTIENIEAATSTPLFKWIVIYKDMQKRYI